MCQRLTCDHPAECRVLIRFLSGRTVAEELCWTHGHRFYGAMLSAPQTASGSCVPLRGSKVAA